MFFLIKQITVFIFFLAFLLSSLKVQSQLYINEIMASNHSTISDNTGAFEDWIEIYNNHTFDINLNDYYISDDISNPQLHRLQSDSNELIVPAEGFLLLWASGDTSRGSKHTNFRLTISGDFVILTAPDGITVIDSILFGHVPTDISYGRYQDSLWRYFQDPTPLAYNNTQAYSGILDPAELSHESGFYNSDFQLTITHPTPGVTLRYTLDGNRPDSLEAIYTNPIQINNRSLEPNIYSMIPTNNWSHYGEWGWYEPDGLVAKGTIVRIKASHPDMISSDKEASFFIFPEKESRYSFPVISIITDGKNLFDDDYGIYVPGSNSVLWNQSTKNYAQRGIEWERPGIMHFFSENGDFEFGQGVGLRIHGGWSRNLPQKSLRLYARNLYGQQNFEYPLFPDLPYSSYKRFILRNSGNDWRSTMFRDALVQSIVAQFNMDIQAYRPTITFINGEYWGIHNIRERYDKHYFERVYGVDPENIDFLENNSVVKEGDNLHYSNLINYLNNNDISNNSVYKSINTLMDIDNFIDYNSTQIFFGNVDWPNNNVKFWRYRVPYDSTSIVPERDGRFRWILFDVDFSFGYYDPNGIYKNMIEWATSKQYPWATLIMRRLLENEQFKIDFINRMADHMNSVFRYQHLSSKIDTFKELVQPEIKEHFKRWGQPQTIADWEQNIDSMLVFSEKRPNVHRQHIQDHFDIQKTLKVQLDVSDESHGYIKINSLNINENTAGIDKNPYPWEGIYFHKIPIKITAIPIQNYKFSHWEINGYKFYDRKIELDMLNDFQAVAYFVKDNSIHQCHESTSYIVRCPYIFTEWSANAASGTFPLAMEFVYMDENDPGLDAEIAGYTNGSYNFNSRTRITGLGNNGVGFINTGNLEGNIGYPGRRIGGALLNINTTEIDAGYVQWTGGTLIPQSRVYNIRLQYRIGNNGPFIDFKDAHGNIVEYKRANTEGHFEIMGPYPLPQDIIGHECVQLFWRYYHTGEQLSSQSGQRDFLRLDDIIIAPGPRPVDPVDPKKLYTEFHISGDENVKPYSTEFYQTDQIANSYNWIVYGGKLLNGQGTPEIEVKWNMKKYGQVKLLTNDNYKCSKSKALTVYIDFSGENKHVNIYPNPNNGQFFLEILSDYEVDYELRLIDLKGITHLNKQIQTNYYYKIDETLPNGLYFLNFTNKNTGYTFIRKVLVIK
ncbi:MAG: T9SS C-terminal target domain-containing protein [Chitinophagaceae bacterium]|nr:MAG: T9SS C-terminal target domain-containing protein [Chitinophagaceae bacterium]